MLEILANCLVSFRSRDLLIIASLFCTLFTVNSSLLFFAPLSYKRYPADFDEYGFPIASYGSCGDLKETSGTLEKTWVIGARIVFVLLLCMLFSVYRQIKDFARTCNAMTPFQEQSLDQAEQVFRIVMFQLTVALSVVLYFLMLKYPQNQYRNFVRNQVLPMINASCNLWYISIPMTSYIQHQQCIDRGNENENISIPSLLDLPMLGPVFET